MTLLAAEAIRIAEHELGGEIHPAITPQRCVNETGHWIVSVQPWRWLRGGMEALAFVAAQPYVDLPADFGSLIAIDGGEGYASSVTPSTLEHILTLRANSSGGTGYFYYAVVNYDRADITGTSTSAQHVVTATTAAAARAKKHPTARLEIFPSPSAAVTDGLLLFYERGWADIKEDTDTIFLPDWMEGVYLRALRCWARGYDNPDYPKDQTLSQLVIGPEFQAAVRRDVMTQRQIGRLRNGAAARGGEGVSHRFTGVVANPT